MSKISKTARGFELVEFQDDNGEFCSIQESSSFEPRLWIGVDEANPKVMARDAHKHGIVTTETNGWIKLPVSEDILFTTRMHLNKNQVKDLVSRLNAWLKTGTMRIKRKNRK